MSAADVVLVGCTKTKRTERSAARDLYDPSDLFRRRRSYAEAQTAPWAIVSALYGLVEPDQQIDPYELTIAQRGTAAYGGTKHWARTILRRCFELAGIPAEFDETLGHTAFVRHLTIEVHAGIDYVRALEEVAGDYRAGVTILHPVRGMQIGEQKAHYVKPTPAPVAALGEQLELVFA